MELPLCGSTCHSPSTCSFSMGRHLPPRPGVRFFSKTSTATTKNSNASSICKRYAERQELPGAHAPAVDVHEIRVRIKPHAAPMHPKRELMQPRGGETLKPHIDGPPLHMQAVLGDAVGVTAQRRISRRGAVAADDFVGSCPVAQSAQISEDVEDSR